MGEFATPSARSIMRFLFSLRISDRIRTGVLAKVIRDARAQNELRLARPPTLITFSVPHLLPGCSCSSLLQMLDDQFFAASASEVGIANITVCSTRISSGSCAEPS